MLTGQAWAFSMTPAAPQAVQKPEDCIFLAASSRTLEYLLAVDSTLIMTPRKAHTIQYRSSPLLLRRIRAGHRIDVDLEDLSRMRRPMAKSGVLLILGKEVAELWYHNLCM